MRDRHIHLLTENISHLNLSVEFKQAAAAQGYSSLNDLVKIRTAELEKQPGFNILLIHEYVNFMERAGLGELIDPRLV
jgi:DNA-directed RNA polymerase alpha subunit